MKLRHLLLLPLLVVSLKAASVDDLTFTLNGDGVSYSVTGCNPAATGEMIIPSTYNGLPVTSIGYDAFYNCTSLTSITIPDGVTSIGYNAFSRCTSMTSITIPDSVTLIGDWAFYYCTSLTSITIPDSVTTIRYSAFYDCTSLTSITIPDSVTSIGEDAFYNTGLSFSEDNYSIKYLLSASGNVAYLIDGSSASGDVVLPDALSGASVTLIGDNAFYRCTSLTSITIPDSVTSIGGAAFYECTSLTSITIPDGVTSIGSGAFSECTRLTSITIPDGVTSIGYRAFYNTGLSFSEDNYSIKYLLSASGNVAYLIDGSSAFGNVTLPSDVQGASVTLIGDNAFSRCTMLTSITIPDSVTSIGGGAFYECTSLTSITIPDSVTTIGAYAFSECTRLTRITIPDSVTSIGGGAFRWCTSLTSIKFDGNAPLQIGNNVFSNIHTNAFVQIKPYATGFSLSTWQGINIGYPRRIYVNANAAVGGDGTSWGTAFNDLQDALAVTDSGRGDQVWIAQGTYYPIDMNNPAEFDRNATFYIKDQVALYGGFIGSETDLAQRDWEANPTILSGEIWEDSSFWSFHVTTIDSNHVTFDGITITKGNASGGNTNYAAAVYGSGTVTATNCTFSENSTTGSGGVADNGTWTATNCTFSGNSASYGGVANNGTWTATNCTFSGNSAIFGGVAYNGTWTATNCTFSGNSASDDGGVAIGGTWTATNCTFSGNSASDEGGVARDGTWTATNCTFSGNSAYYYGGVAHNSTWTATNCTFSGNSASYNGGVARDGTWTATNCTFTANSSHYGGVSYDCTWKIFNNIFYDNSGNGQFYNSTIYATNEATPSPFAAFANNLIQGGSAAFVSCTSYILESNLIDADPLFVDAADPAGPDEIWGTEDDGLRLQSSSPAIGLGDADYLPLDTYDLDGDDDTAESLPVDIAGYKRIQDTTLDLGAYEYGDLIGLGSVFTTTAGAATGGSVSPSGAIVNTQPTEITLVATADNGYVFGYWTGDIPEELELDNPLTLTVEADGAITAVFSQDSSDSDGDGLTKYQEVIVYGTDPDDADSDDDGFSDGFEVETGFSPLSSTSSPDAVAEMLTAVEFRFNAANGVSYRIESSSDLENWSTVEAEIIGSGGRVTRFYSIEGTQKQFYRPKLND